MIPSTEAILESISDGVFTVDSNWRIVSFNRAAEQITGISRQHAMGQLCSEVFKSGMCETECALRKTLKTNTPIINQSGFIINAKGVKIPVSVSTAVLRDEKGNIIGGAETFRDLSEVEALRHRLLEQNKIGDVIFRSQVMAQVMELVRIVSASPSSVLIVGETGSGKEVIARTIHNLSSHAKDPFIAVNCSALPDTLLESELFGYRKGAFTGADKDKPGRFALAGHGTLFLDEIGDISPAMQVRLLRVLQEKSYEPLGATKSETVKARIITATHHQLEKQVELGTFRQDLYYRINVITISLPPLRERKEDIPILADYFVEKFNHWQQRSVPGISPAACNLLLQHSWPGNVRELENVIERAFILCNNREITPMHLPAEWQGQIVPEIAGSDLQNVKKDSETRLILAVLKQTNYQCLQAAQQLGIHKTTLYRKLKQLGINIDTLR